MNDPTPPRPTKKFPREIIGRALMHPGFRAYLLQEPEDCLTEHGYGEFAAHYGPKIRAAMKNPAFQRKVEDLNQATTSEGGVD